jgi:hypothetical protein
MPFSFSVPAFLSPRARSAFSAGPRPVGRRSGAAAVQASMATIAAASLTRRTSAMSACSLRGCHIGGFLAALVFAIAVNTSHAAVTITLQEQGNDVVATASGNLNLAALTLSAGTNTQGGAIVPAVSVISLGPVQTSVAYDDYRGATGPSSFGTGFGAFPTAFSGDFVATSGTSSIRVPVGYSGGSINSTATWANTDFATLGVTPGDYVWSWGSGANADTLTLSAGTPVPEPSTWALGAFALACGGWQLTRRRRALRGQA